MLRIKDTIFSIDVLEKKFKCDLPKCQGSCCRYGDSGAPLLSDEVRILEEIWPVIRKYLRPEGIKAIEAQGTSITDRDNDRVTPLINNEECAYAILNGPVYMCSIEQAWHEKVITFQKPLSCHLFPVRIKKFSGFTAVNYEEIAICSPARDLGVSEGKYVYEFLKIPLTRALGKEIYNELCIAARVLRKRKTI
ncbi:MAG: DUF3109 family protein [Bacteroidales bacterium]